MFLEKQRRNFRVRREMKYLYKTSGWHASLSRVNARDPSVEVFPQFRCPYTMPKGRARILLDASFRFVLSLFSPSLFLLSLSIPLSFSKPSYSVALLLLERSLQNSARHHHLVMLRKFRGIVPSTR